MTTKDSWAALSIPDLATGSAYLAGLALPQPALAEQQLMRFLDALLAAPPDPGVLFSLLEQARAPLGDVEDELAKRYHNRALPLGEEEEVVFQQVIAAWRKMAKAYALCARLEEPDVEHPDYAALMATLLHRCIYYMGMVVLEHYRARRELPEGIWLDLHGYYETAEEWGVAYTPVRDVLETALQASNCSAAYATLLLIDIACPYSNSLRNVNLIRRWAGAWSSLVSIHVVDNDLNVPPYIVELMKDVPLHPSASVETLGGDVRWLDTTRLGFQITHMLSQLRQRITPTQLGLGEETTGHVIDLLEHLLRPWTQSAVARRFRRFATSGKASVAVGFEGMHYCVTGKEFIQPDSANTYSRGEFDQLFTFRDRADPGQGLTIKPRISFPLDEWSVINHSANGFRLARSSAGQRLMHGQLMVVRPHDGGHYLLAQATWLMQEASGGLIVGVATLPGMPIGVGVRPAAPAGGTVERYVRAFILPAVPAIKEEGSIVIPAGLYQASRVLEVFNGEENWMLRMMHVLQRGTDFDRISFQAV